MKAQNLQNSHQQAGYTPSDLNCDISKNKNEKTRAQNIFIPTTLVFMERHTLKPKYSYRQANLGNAHLSGNVNGHIGVIQPTYQHTFQIQPNPTHSFDDKQQLTTSSDLNFDVSKNKNGQAQTQQSSQQQVSRNTANVTNNAHEQQANKPTKLQT